jgi:hypothetical protein
MKLVRRIRRLAVVLAPMTMALLAVGAKWHPK